MRLRYLVLLIGLAYILGVSCQGGNSIPEYKANRGFLDLSGHDFDRYGVVTLGGEWLFFDQQLLERIPANTENTAVVKVPQTWYGEGFGTYALKLKLPVTSQNFKLHMEAQLSAYEIFVSGVRRANSGKPATTKAETQPATRPLSAVIGQNSEQQILLRVANFHHRKGGLFKKIQLGTEPAIDRMVSSKRALDLILSGVLVMTSIYFVIVFLYRMGNKAELYFSLACLTILGRTLTTGEKTILQAWPDVPFAFYTMVEYLSYFWGVPFTLSFFCSLYPGILNRWIILGFYATSAFFTLVVFLTPLHIYSHTAYLYIPVLVVGVVAVIITLLRALWRREHGASLLSAGFLTLSLTLANDMLNTLEILRTGYIVQYGFIAIVVCFAAVLAARFAKALADTERAEEELRLVNVGLEQRVSERTKQLEEAKNLAEEANRQKDNFLAVVSHDMRSPLSGVLNALQMLNAGNITEQTRQELSVAAEKSTVRMLKTLESLLSVRRVQAAPAATQEAVFPATVAREIIAEISSEAQKRDVRIVNEIPTQWTVKAKPEILRHVLANLISNAVKFTPAGGSVVLYRPERNEPAITVKDEGMGMEVSLVDAIKRGEKIQSRTGLSGEKGSGLGLALCREMLMRAGGRLEVESEPGKGSALTIVLAN